MATRSDLLTRLKCAEARWGPTLVGAIFDHFHGPSLLMGRQALRPYRYRRIPVGGHEAVANEICLPPGCGVSVFEIGLPIAWPKSARIGFYGPRAFRWATPSWGSKPKSSPRAFQDALGARLPGEAVFGGIWDRFLKPREP